MSKEAEKVNERNREAAMTREEAIEWANVYWTSHGTWPTRRYRVEKSPVGNSRLLNEQRAKDTQKKYGGEMVELIPSRQEYEITLHRAQAEKEEAERKARRGQAA